MQSRRYLVLLSLTISRDEYVAVLGKSRSGTSTLRNLIAGLERPTSGVIQVAGTELAGMSETRWLFGGVLQFFLLLPTLTVFAMSTNRKGRLQVIERYRLRKAKYAANTSAGASHCG